MVAIRFKTSAFALTSTFALLCAMPAFSADQLEEIVITAQKREERLQEAPIAVTALSRDVLTSRGINTAVDLNSVAPNLNVTQTSAGASDSIITLRGIGQPDAGQSLDSPVGMYIDGVIQARISGVLFDLVDLERVEVLRGPQGTLYGRNTTGGAINFITRRPADEFGVTQKVGYSTYNGFVSRTVVDTGKLGNTGLKANIAFLYDKKDGYYDNTLRPSDEDPGATDNKAIRGEIAFDNGGPLTASYSFYYVNANEGNLAPSLSFVNANLAAALVPGSYVLGGGRQETLALNSARLSESELYLHNLTLEWEVSDSLTVKSITGYRHYDGRTGSDLDGNGPILANVFSLTTFTTSVQPVDLFAATNRRQQEQFSQELQLVGEWTERFKYVVGGFYFTENGSERNPQSFFVPGPIPPFIAGGRGIIALNQHSFNSEGESWAVFGQATYTPPIFDDRLSATMGLRYTEDTKTLEKLTGVTQFVPVTGFGHQSFNNLSYSATLDFKASQDVLTYARYSTGYKAGGFNPRAAITAGQSPSFDEETLEAYEIGLKADWFQRRLRTNLAAFYNIYRNLQVSSFVPGGLIVIENAGRARYKGVEFEVTAVPVDGVTLNMSVGYVDPSYDKFIITSPLGLTEDVAKTANFVYTSQITTSAGIQYDSDPLPWAGGAKFQGRIDVFYQSAQDYTTGQNFSNGERVSPFEDFANGDARTLVNGRIALKDIPIGSTAASMEVALWGKNILDEAYVIQGIDFGSLGYSEVTYGAPRTGGIELTIRY